MRRLLWIPVALVAFLVATAAWWRRHPRFGSNWVNRVVDPWVVREGFVAKSEGEIGLIEHVGRKSGIVRVSPVHPVPTEDGFRIVVPLGLESEWAHNVLTAGRCRLQIGETVYELDEPMLISPMLVEEIPPMVQHLMVWLGFQYLQLRRFAEAPGTLTVAAEAEAPEIVATAEAEIEPGLVPV
jgi:deazaflavin-dependent oxidoreductase (nitroreductase family)